MHHISTEDTISSILHPAAYYSSKLKLHQLHYSTIVKEALALIMALKKFECYLHHHPDVINVQTDYNPLIFIKHAQLLNQRILQCALQLQPFNLKIHHIKGVDNLLADALLCAQQPTIKPSPPSAKFFSGGNYYDPS